MDLTIYTLPPSQRLGPGVGASGQLATLPVRPLKPVHQQVPLQHGEPWTQGVHGVPPSPVA